MATTKTTTKKTAKREDPLAAFKKKLKSLRPREIREIEEATGANYLDSTTWAGIEFQSTVYRLLRQRDELRVTTADIENATADEILTYLDLNDEEDDEDEDADGGTE